MMRGDYPTGASSSSLAPYNEVDNPKREFDLYISQSFSKDVKCVSSSYCPDGYTDECGMNQVDNRNTDWFAMYRESHYTIQELLEKLKLYAEKELKQAVSKNHIEHLKNIIQECDSWVCDEELVLRD